MMVVITLHVADSLKLQSKCIRPNLPYGKNAAAGLGNFDYYPVAVSRNFTKDLMSTLSQFFENIRLTTILGPSLLGLSI